jgi:hypothetical protein
VALGARLDRKAQTVHLQKCLIIVKRGQQSYAALRFSMTCRKFVANSR